MRGLVTIACVVTVLSATVDEAAAATIAVNDLGDGPDLDLADASCDAEAAAGAQCTLRAAMEEADDTPAETDEIVFEVTGEIAIGSQLPQINSEVTISGPGAGALTVRRPASAGAYRIAVNGVNGKATISGITLAGGRTTSGSGGGAILNVSGELTLRDAVVTENLVATTDENAFGGGISSIEGKLSVERTTVSANTVSAETTTATPIDALGGGIYVEDELGPIVPATIADSVISGNSALATDGVVAAAKGGGIAQADGLLTIRATAIRDNLADAAVFFAVGGGVFNDAGVGVAPAGINVVDTTVSGNRVSAPGGANAGGGLQNLGAMSIDSSTVSANRVEAVTGTDLTQGAGVGHFAVDGALGILNSTITANVAEGIGLGGGVAAHGSGGSAVARLASSTVVGNSASESASLDVGGPPLEIANTIVAAPLGGGANCGSGATTESLGHNLEDADSCALEEPTDLTGVDPLLGPLAENGGPTPTHALLTGSPAVDAGRRLNPALPSDQRGELRPVDLSGVANAGGSDGSDIGAFEAQAVPPGGDGGEDAAGDDGGGAGDAGGAGGAGSGPTGGGPPGGGGADQPRQPSCRGERATLVAEPGERVRGSRRADVIVGTAGADEIRARGGADLICAGGGDDAVRSGGGNDDVRASGGGDRVVGQGGRDRLRGQGGTDRLKGQGGRDALRGNGGRDRLSGGSARDRLSGGGGRDRCRGGGGRDRASKCER